MENTFKVGDNVYRKNRECRIVHIDRTTVPVSLTVFMIDTQSEVGTEFKYITKDIVEVVVKKQKNNKKNKHKKRCNNKRRKRN